MDIPVETALAKIGLLVLENEELRSQVAQLEARLGVLQTKLEAKPKRRADSAPPLLEPPPSR